MILVIICLGLLALLGRSILNYVQRVRGMRKNGCEPARKYPHKDPILGLDLILEDININKKGNHLKALQERFEKYGKTYEQLRPDRTRMVHTMEPKMAQHIATNIQTFGLEPMRYGFPPTRDFFGRGILAVDGSFWEHSRALIKPIFGKAQIANLKSLDQHFTRMMSYIPDDGSTVDLQPLFKRLFVDTGMEFIFGESANTLAPTTESNPDSFVNAFDKALILLGKRLVLGPLWFLAGGTAEYKAACRKVQTTCDDYVARAMRKKPSDTEKGLQEDEDEASTKTYFLPYELGKVVDDPVELRFQLMQIFFPARDTIAIAVSNIFFFLARHPKVFEKLRKEVESIGDVPLSFEVLKSMLYVRYVYNESKV